MARILFRGDWYYELTPTTLLEDEFEALILQHSSELFPDYIAVPFKTIVESDSGSAKADLALIHKAYHHWWVVEVEMGRHSLSQHVLPQIQTLVSAYYGRHVVDSLCQVSPEMDRRKLELMLKGSQPRILVIVDSPRPDWQSALRPIGAQLTVFQVFRSEKNEHLFRVNGEPPRPDVTSLTLCHSDPTIPQFLVVESPQSLLNHGDATLKIFIDGRQSTWTRLESEDRVYLVPEGANPLHTRKKYAIMEDANGELHFHVHGERVK